VQTIESSNRVVLVTGAASGIGRAIAEGFANNGDSVVIADLDGERARDVAEAIHATSRTPALACSVDVRDATAVEAMVRSVLDRFGRIDVLVNNAGIYPNSLVLEMDEAEWDAVFDTNVKGMFLVSRAVAKTMVERGEGGRIVNMSSGAAESGRVGAAHYCGSRGAVKMFTQVLAMELGPHQINVNAVGPGLIDVPTSQAPKEYVDAFVAATPMGRIGKMADVVPIVLFLASPGAAFVSGTTYYVDGGWLAGKTLPQS
jgi:3-oxoacyl-[acyl-carrier protein] reductase